MRETVRSEDAARLLAGRRIRFAEVTRTSLLLDLEGEGRVSVSATLPGVFCDETEREDED